MSTPTGVLPGPACSTAPSEPSVSASTQDAPPCSTPAGCVLPATGIVPTTRPAEASTSVIPIRSTSVFRPAAANAARTCSCHWAAGSCVTGRLRSGGTPPACRSRSLGLADGCHDPGPRQGPAAAHRRAFPGLPGLSRAAAGELRHHHRAADERRVRLHRDVRRVLVSQHPTHIAVAFDRGEKTFRHEQYVDYKANRSETPADFRTQLSLIFEVLDALGIRRMSVPGYEADDIIATLATEAEQAGFDVLIVTGDRDVLQLVDEHTTALMTRRGISEMTRFTPETVTAKYGLTPAQYPDFAAIRGDPSDNLPSIPGVGEKTAAKWVADVGSLGELVDRVDEVKGKAGDKLREHLSDVLRNRQLTELAKDVPLEVGPADLRPAAWDREQIHQLFDTLQFRVLRDRLYSTLPNGIGGVTALAGPGDAAGGTFDVEITLPGPEEVAGWLAEHAAGEGRTGVAVSGTWGRGTGNLTGLALATPDGAGAYLDPDTLTEDDEQALAGWLADPGRPKAMHDAKGPIHALAARGLELAGLTTDTALAAYLALPGQRSFDLADLVLRYLSKELKPVDEAATGQLALDLSGDDGDDDGEAQVATALVLQARATAELGDALDADLERRGATRLLHEVELPLIDVLAGMERAGIAADTDHFAAMSASLGGEVKSAEQSAYAVVGREFNLGSPKQLQEVLFNELGLPKT